MVSYKAIHISNSFKLNSLLKNQKLFDFEKQYCEINMQVS